MSTEHRIINDPEIHEPKNITLAPANSVYKADGASSGSWVKVNSAMLQGISGDGGIAGRSIVSDGANGFTLFTDIAFGAMTITNNAVAQALTAVADTTFNTASQYTLMTGASFPWVSENLQGITFTTDRLTVPTPGVYLISFYGNISAFPSTVARLSLRFRVSGGTYATRKPIVKSSGTGSELQIVGTGLISLAANDYLQLYIASDVTGNATIRDASLALHKVG